MECLQAVGLDGAVLRYVMTLGIAKPFSLVPIFLK